MHLLQIVSNIAGCVDSRGLAAWTGQFKALGRKIGLRGMQIILDPSGFADIGMRETFQAIATIHAPSGYRGRTRLSHEERRLSDIASHVGIGWTV